MIRTIIVSTALVMGLLTARGVAAGPYPPPIQSAAHVSGADAAPFIGEWILALQGPDGPGKFDLVVKVEKEKVAGAITAPGGATEPITDVTKTGSPASQEASPALLRSSGRSACGRSRNEVVREPAGRQNNGETAFIRPYHLGSLQDRWTVTLIEASLVPVLPLTPLKELPGEVVPMPAPPPEG